MNGVAAPAGLPSRNTSIRDRSSGSYRSSTRRPVSAGSTAYAFPSSGTVAVRVTRRVTDQRNASRSRSGSGLPRRPAGLEPADRGLPGLGVHPPVGDLPGPRGEQVVQRVQRFDAVVDGLGQERLPDIAVQPLLFSAPFRRVGFRMHQPDAQHPAGAGQPRIRKRRSVISIEHLGQAAAGDRPAQQVLAGAGVLVREEPAIDQQPGMIIDDQEQPGPHRAVPARPRHPRADQHVGDPPLVRPGSLIAPICLGLGGQRLAVQPGPAQLAADGPLRDRDPVPVIQDRGDLRG